MTSIFTTKEEGEIGRACSASVVHFCSQEKIVEVDCSFPLPDSFIEVARDPRISEKTISDVARLFAVCSWGGISVSSDFCFTADSKELEGFESFCASTKTFVPLSCIFGTSADSKLSQALMSVLDEAVAGGIDLMVRLQESIGVVQSLFLHPTITPLVTFLPYQRFAVFGVQSNARDFVLADEEKRKKMLDQISGRLRGISPIGVFAGHQDHVRPPAITDVVQKNLWEQEPAIISPPRPLAPLPARVTATVGQMAAGIIQLAKDTAKSAISGEVIGVNDEEKAARLKICTGDETSPACEFYVVNQKRCGKCGCFMELKARIKSQSCPLGRW